MNQSLVMPLIRGPQSKKFTGTKPVIDTKILRNIMSRINHPNKL